MAQFTFTAVLLALISISSALHRQLGPGWGGHQQANLQSTVQLVSRDSASLQGWNNRGWGGQNLGWSGLNQGWGGQYYIIQSAPQQPQLLRIAVPQVRQQVIRVQQLQLQTIRIQQAPRIQVIRVQQPQIETVRVQAAPRIETIRVQAQPQPVLAAAPERAPVQVRLDHGVKGRLF